jgi:hypothetical protein
VGALARAVGALEALPRVPSGVALGVLAPEGPAVGFGGALLGAALRG